MMNKSITKIVSKHFKYTLPEDDNHCGGEKGGQQVRVRQTGQPDAYILCTIVLDFRVGNTKHIYSEGKLESLT